MGREVREAGAVRGRVRWRTGLRTAFSSFADRCRRHNMTDSDKPRENWEQRVMRIADTTDVEERRIAGGAPG